MGIAVIILTNFDVTHLSEVGISGRAGFRPAEFASRKLPMRPKYRKEATVPLYKSVVAWCSRLLRQCLVLLNLQ